MNVNIVPAYPALSTTAPALSAMQFTSAFIRSPFRATLLRSGLLAATLLASCGTLAPRYEQPAAPVATIWPSTPTVLSGDPAAAIGWRNFISDEHLRQLVTQALSNNRDARIATLNIEKARAQYQVQDSNLFPSISANASNYNARTLSSVTPNSSRFLVRTNTVNVGFSAYELDLFGRLRSLSKQAQESYLSSIESQRAVQISLIAEVASAYLTLAADRDLLTLAKDTLHNREESLKLGQRRFDLGATSQLDFTQIQAGVEVARADVASFTRQAALDQNALTLLVGGNIATDLLPTTLPTQVTLLQDIPAGVPSETLQQRPDVLAAEHQLKAANANIGAARAAFFPSISLTANTGTASNKLSGLFEGGSNVWTFAPQLNLPIFDAGRNLANLRISKLNREIAVAQYEKSIQTAFREVADALAAQATRDQELSARLALVTATEASYKLSEARYNSGLDSYLQQLDAQRSLYSAQQNLVTVRLSRLSTLITLYKALGGGVLADSISVTSAK